MRPGANRSDAGRSAIVQIFDFGQYVDGAPYIVMELLEGESLEARLRKRGRLAPGEALAILRQVASDTDDQCEDAVLLYAPEVMEHEKKLRARIAQNQRH